LELSIHTNRKEKKAMSRFGVHSEVGKLRKVIVHRPDLSLQRLTPSNCAELLFDDVLWVERAQLEHDQFVEVMRSRGVEVFYVLDMLTETLEASQEAKRLLIEQVVTEYTVGWSLVDEMREFLWNLGPDSLAEYLIGGLTAGESGIDWDKYGKISLYAASMDDMNTFLMPPLPNTIFTRDSSSWIYEGVSINPMYWFARRRESLNMYIIYHYHPMFKDKDFKYWYPNSTNGEFNMQNLSRSSLEGGDVLPIGNRTVLIGMSEYSFYYA
jgi:arginine deiminase